MSYQYKYQNYSIALYEALLEDAFYATMEQSITDTTFGKEAMLRYMDYSMVEAKKYDEIVGHMTENGAALIDKNDWYLSIVGVLPEYQGKGLGVELVN